MSSMNKNSRAVLLMLIQRILLDIFKEVFSLSVIVSVLIDNYFQIMTVTSSSQVKSRDLDCLALDAKNILKVYTRTERKSSEICFNESAVTYHIAKANQVIDWKGTKIVTGGLIRNSDKSLAIRISQSPHVMNRDRWWGIQREQHLLAFVFHLFKCKQVL